MFGKNLAAGLSIALLLVLASGGVMLAAPGDDTQLADAAMRNDVAAVRSLLDSGADVNAAQGDGNTALHWAAYHGNAEMAKMLLEAKADVSAETRINGMTPIFLAAKIGQAEIVKGLLAAGADANAKTTTGTTPLMLAAGSGRVEAIQALLGAGADVNAQDTVTGQTAAMYAAALNRGPAITLLADRGADLNLLTKVTEVKGGDRGSGFRRKRNTVYMGGNAALHFAAREGQLDAVKALVAAGADVNLQTANDQTPPMTQALITGKLDVAKYLLDQGADPNLANVDGLTALYATLDAQYAQRTWYPPPSVEQETVRYLDLMKDLLARGADPNVRLEKRLWYRQFGNAGSPEREGATPFWRATQALDLPAMKMLLAAGADPSINTTKDSSPLMVASGIHFSNQGLRFVPEARMDVVRFLVEELGADVNHKDDRGHTPLHGAALIGNHELILYLVDNGADVTARANTISGSGDGGGTEQVVDPGTGDSPADMANGWTMNSPQYLETVDLLVKLGSPFQNTCWASNCVNPTISDDKVNGRNND